MRVLMMCYLRILVTEDMNLVRNDGDLQIDGQFVGDHLG